MQEVIVTQKLKIKVDSWGNHEPVEFRLVKDTKTGIESEKWVHSARYYPNLSLALQSVVKYKMAESEEVLTIEEYIVKLDSLQQSFITALSKH